MGYSILSDTQISGLVLAGANPSQFAAYAALTRAHKLEKYPGNPSWCYRSVADISRITGLHRDTCARALRALCSMEFVPGVTVLEKVGGGHRGQASVFADNLWSYSEIVEQEPIGRPQSPTNEPTKGGSQSPTNEPTKGGSQSPTNEAAERWTESTEKVDGKTEKVDQQARKGRPQSPTQNRNTEQIPRIDAQNSGKERKEERMTLDRWTRDRFEDWLWDRCGTNEPAKVFYAWWRRLMATRPTNKTRAEVEGRFAELDRIAEGAPTCDADVSPEDLATVEAARGRWINPRINLYDAWLILTWDGRRDAEWVDLLRADNE